jgi:hypothetical protein
VTGKGIWRTKVRGLFAKAQSLGEPFLIRIVQNRMTAGNKRILDEIRKKRCQGRDEATIPRDSRSSIIERKSVLQLRYASFSIKRLHILNFFVKRFRVFLPFFLAFFENFFDENAHFFRLKLKQNRFPTPYIGYGESCLGSLRRSLYVKRA